ncbi:hypothetical protein EDC56_3237 [Sinobacterium caligoides]|uniref:Uncharacterized protein n=1 Tax=Sinobacterium caligoides TaxID=933926 RepID=A0A3N2DGS7_9GAMM|nr:hypothetical protein [Sinobacterium caligoides]ROR98997.1 hypothetical protein EDC56_3237 [Sinobacterium caligoides]
MDFIPILIAILFSPFDGFSLLSSAGDTPVLHYYSELEAGEPITLQCLNSDGDYVNITTAQVGHHNYNENFTNLPIRRASLALPTGNQCSVISNQSTLKKIWPDSPCTLWWQVSFTTTQTYRVLHNGEAVNLWDNLETAKFIRSIKAGDNIRLAANAVNLNSTNQLQYSQYTRESGYAGPLANSYKEYGGNGINCGGDVEGYNTDDQISISFGISNPQDDIGLFNFGFNYKEPSGTIYDDYENLEEDIYKAYKRGSEGMIINITRPEVWDISLEQWEYFRQLLI